MTDFEKHSENIIPLINGILNDSAIFLVDLKIKQGNKVIVYIDGDQGVNINAIAKINRALRKKIEEENIFSENDFALEVSSPGIDKPLKLFRQYKKNIGRDVIILLDEEKEVKGKMINASEAEVVIERALSKKQKMNNEEAVLTIPFSKIVSTKVEIKF